MKKVTYLEQRFFDNGTAQAKLHSTKPKIEQNQNCDIYLESIGKGQPHETLEAYVTEELCIETREEIESLIEKLQAGEWVDFGQYC